MDEDIDLRDFNGRCRLFPLPGTNTVIREFSEQYGIPFEASRGGAETMYPEYQKKLKQMTIPRPKVFDVKFAREHPKETKP